MFKITMPSIVKLGRNKRIQLTSDAPEDARAVWIFEGNGQAAVSDDGVAVGVKVGTGVAQLWANSVMQDAVIIQVVS